MNRWFSETTDESCYIEAHFRLSLEEEADFLRRAKEINMKPANYLKQLATLKLYELVLVDPIEDEIDQFTILAYSEEQARYYAHQAQPHLGFQDPEKVTCDEIPIRIGIVAESWR